MFFPVLISAKFRDTVQSLRERFAHSPLSLFAQINFKCIEIVFCPKPRSRSLVRPVRERRVPHPSLGLSQNTARACAGLPNHIPIDFYAEKSRLFTLSSPPSLLGRLSSKPNPFHSAAAAAEREAKTFHALHHLAPPSPVLSGPLSLSLPLGRSHMQHAFRLHR